MEIEFHSPFVGIGVHFPVGVGRREPVLVPGNEDLCACVCMCVCVWDNLGNFGKGTSQKRKISSRQQQNIESPPYPKEDKNAYKEDMALATVR